MGGKLAKWQMDALDISKPAANIVWNISSKYKTAKKHNSVLVQHVCWPCIHVHLTIGTTTHTSSMQTLLYFTHVGQHFRYPSISFDVSLITWHTMTLLEISSISLKKKHVFIPAIDWFGGHTTLESRGKPVHNGADPRSCASANVLVTRPSGTRR